MTLLDYIAQYKEMADQGVHDDRTADTIVELAEKLFKSAASGQRLKSEQEWYINERYLEGDHWLKFDRKAGTITYPKQQKRVRRDINLARKQLRALKSFILSQRFTWEVSPKDETPEAEQEAQEYNQVLGSYVYDLLDVPMKLYDVITNGIVKRYGSWELVWDDTIDNLRLTELDSFDVYPDPSVRNPRDGQFLFKASKVATGKIKKNKAYFERRTQVSGDSREAASDFKDSLEKYRGTSGEKQSSDESQTAIIKELFLKRDDGTLCLIAYADGKLIRAEWLSMKSFPVLFYFPERNNHGLYGATWFRDIRTINRIFENAMSIVEDYILKIKPKILRPKGSSIKPITDELGEFLEYSQAIPDQLKEWMPQGLPATHFQLINIARDLVEDVGGVHAASSGKIPVGVKSGRGIEALQAADENNVGEPKQMLERFLEETGELALELISAHQVTQKTVTRYDGKKASSHQIMGVGGMMEGTTPAPNVLVIKPSKVNVSIVPSVGYTEEGKRQTALDLYRENLIDRETALETYRFSNVGDIARKAEEEQAKKAKSTPPPPPVPADKLMQGLAALAKSGEPVTVEQVQEVMRQAGLPAAEFPPPEPPLQ